MIEEVELKWISGFWRRVGALIIDTLILGVTGLLLGLLFERYFVEMAGWGRLVGFSIALIYFSVMNSSIAGGQTIGKKILDLRVVDSNNAPISFSKSVLRYFILAVPFLLNGAQFSNEVLFSFLMYPISLVLFGGILSILYLYIFNRMTRQSLHDLAVGSYVVNSYLDKKELEKVWKPHFVVIVLLLMAAAVAPAFTAQLAQQETFKDMLVVQSALSHTPDVTYSTITIGSSRMTSTQEGTREALFVSVNAFLKTDSVKNVELARELAKIVINNYSDAQEKDTLLINLIYGYDIGISAKWSNYTHRFTPLELKNLDYL